jgi:hypothetical protein
MDADPLEAAMSRLEAEPDSDPVRLAFWERFLGSEVWLLLETEEEPLRPLILTTGDGPVALAFASESRMAAFIAEPTPCAALSGRRLVAALAGRGVMLGINLGLDAPGSLQPAEAIDWAAGLASPLAEIDGRVGAVGPPQVRPGFLAALDARLAALAGRGAEAWLANARHADGGESTVLAMVGVAPADRPAVLETMAEAFRLAGEDGTLDVLFADEVPEAFRRHGLGFTLPEVAPPIRPSIPGSDPDRPPRLR